MADFEPDFLEILTPRAKEWAIYLRENALEGADRARIAIALGRVKNRIEGLIINNLRHAIEGTEFDEPVLKGHLISVFQSNEIVNVDIDGNIYFTAEDVAGDDKDYYDGIQVARQTLGIGQGGTAEQRAKIWKQFIYQPAREGIHPEDWTPEKVEQAKGYYERTIDARVAAWGGKAPYWYFLEHGNVANDLAYPPPQEPTRFLENSRIQGQQLFNEALRNVIIEEGNVLEQEGEKFLADPKSFKPGEILNTFYAEGKKYYIYVTPVKRLVGVISRRPD